MQRKLTWFVGFGNTSDETSSDIKRKKSQSDNALEYEKVKRKRSFQEHWRNEFPWVDFDSDSSTMHCKTCRKYPGLADKNSSLVVGINSFRKDSLTVHNKSVQHMKCEEKQLSDEITQSESSSTRPMDIALAKLNEQNLQKLKSLFNTAYFIAKEDIAMSKFGSLCELQEKNGLDVGNSYRNHMACKHFLTSCADVLQAETADQVKKSRFLTVLADGSTDVTSIEKEIVYVRYLVNGLPVTRLAGIVDLQKGDAEGIFAAIKVGLNSVGILELERLVCVNFDGAAVMMGRKTGVAQRINAEVAHTIPIHCVAHRLELSVLDVTKDIEYMTVFQNTLKTVFKLYYYSPKKRRELSELGEIYEETVSHFCGLKEIRWLPSQKRAITALEKNYHLTICHLEHMSGLSGYNKDDSSKARGLLKQLTSRKFAQYMYFLLDLYEVLALLSEQLQRLDLLIIEVPDFIQAAKLKLAKLKDVPGKNQKAMTERTANISFKPSHLEKMSAEEGLNEEFKQIIESTTKYLNRRFENFLVEPLSNFNVFDYTLWPSQEQDLINFGDKEIISLVNHFKLILTEDEIEKAEDEWMDLKLYLSKRKSQKLFACFVSLLQTTPENVRNISALVSIMMTLSPSTAACERGFSCLNRIKTKYRSALQSSTLSNLMKITVDGPNLKEFSPDAALQHWLQSSKGSRHIFHQL